MKLVCLTGIDGSGKTTLARCVVNRLCQNGLSAAYVYGRTTHTFSLGIIDFGRQVFLRQQAPQKDYGVYHALKKEKMRNPLLRWAYTVLVVVEYYLQIWLRLLPHWFKRRVVVCDRYVYDTVINDLAVHLGYTAKQTEEAIGRGEWFLPKPRMIILMDLPEEVAFSRKTDVPNVDFLRERRNYYFLLKSFPETMVMNGERAIEELADEITARVISLNGGGR